MHPLHTRTHIMWHTSNDDAPTAVAKHLSTSNALKAPTAATQIGIEWHCAETIWSSQDAVSL